MLNDWIIEQIRAHEYPQRHLDHAASTRGIVSCDLINELAETQELPTIAEREEG